MTISNNELSRAINEGKVHGEGVSLGEGQSVENPLGIYNPSSSEKIEIKLLNLELNLNLKKEDPGDKNAEQENEHSRIDLLEALKSVENQPTLELIDVKKGDIICLDVSEEGGTSQDLVYWEVQNDLEPNILRPQNMGADNQMLVKTLKGSKNPFLEEEPNVPEIYYISGSTFGRSSIAPSTITRGLYIRIVTQDEISMLCKAPRAFAVLRKNDEGEYHQISANQLKSERLFEGSENFQYLSSLVTFLDDTYLVPELEDNSGSFSEHTYISYEWKAYEPVSGIEIRYKVHGFDPEHKEQLARKIVYIDHNRNVFYIINYIRNLANPEFITFQVQEFHGVKDTSILEPYGNVEYEIARNYSNSRIMDTTMAFNTWEKGHALENYRVVMSRNGLRCGHKYSYLPIVSGIETDLTGDEIIISRNGMKIVEFPVGDQGFIKNVLKRSVEQLGDHLQMIS